MFMTNDGVRKTVFKKLRLHEMPKTLEISILVSSAIGQ